MGRREDRMPGGDDRVGILERPPPLLHAGLDIADIVTKLHHAYLGVVSKMVEVVSAHQHDVELYGLDSHQG